MNKALFGEKLAHYAKREPKHFLQLDGFYLPHGGDDLMRPDDDGDAICAQGTVELMHGATVRILIPGDADPKVAARQLKKLAKWFKRKPSLLDFGKTPLKTIPKDDLPF